MTSGDYEKYKVKRWLEQDGWVVELTEKYIRFFDKKNQKTKMIKKDIFGSDMIAMNGKDIIFIQVKKGKKNVAEARKKFAEYPFPSFVKRWIVVCEKGKEPEIEEALK